MALPGVDLKTVKPVAETCVLGCVRLPENSSTENVLKGSLTPIYACRRSTSCSNAALTATLSSFTVRPLSPGHLLFLALLLLPEHLHRVSVKALQGTSCVRPRNKSGASGGSASDA